MPLPSSPTSSHTKAMALPIHPAMGNLEAPQQHPNFPFLRRNGDSIVIGQLPESKEAAIEAIAEVVESIHERLSSDIHAIRKGASDHILTAVEYLAEQGRISKETLERAVIPHIGALTKSLQSTENTGALLGLHTLREHHSATTYHAKETGIISMDIARLLKEDTELLGLSTREIQLIQELTASDIAFLGLAGMTHDIGKAFMPLEIIDKPGKFTDKERKIMEFHPDFGHRFLGESPLGQVAGLHHQKFHHEEDPGYGICSSVKALQQVNTQIALHTGTVGLADKISALKDPQRSYHMGRGNAETLMLLNSMCENGEIHPGIYRTIHGSIMRDTIEKSRNKSLFSPEKNSKDSRLRLPQSVVARIPGLNPEGWYSFRVTEVRNEMEVLGFVLDDRNRDSEGMGSIVGGNIEIDFSPELNFPNSTTLQ